VAGKMIDFLKISSMAIFDEIEIDFTSGLNCITGETGAGKSLILDALTMLMGARAGREMIRPGREKAVVEALFTVSDREMVLRRELYPTGGSRCYIDGKLTTSSGLVEVSSGLIHIYGQHDYQDLLNPRQQMRILEDYAGISRENVEESYKEYTQAEEAYKELVQLIDSFMQEKEYLEHCLKELTSTNIHEGLEERLTQEVQTARKSSDLKQASLAAQELIYTGTPSITDLTAEARQQIHRIVVDDPSMDNLMHTMDEIMAQLEDMHGELRGRIDAYEYDPQHIEELEERLNSLREIKRKHRTDEAGLIRLTGDIQQKLSMLNESGNNTSSAQKKVDETRIRYHETAKTFLEKRLRAAKSLCKRINADLEDLGMPGTDFRVSQLSPDDVDKAFLNGEGKVVSPAVLLKGDFLISTNVGQNILPLTKIASGGELSRIMLAIKVSQKTSSEATMIFDEIDAGISGQTAIAIADKLKELSGHAQTIVVTHLHQVASAADSHFVITKTVKAKSTSSALQKVRSADRVKELARMMGGDSPSLSVIEHAKELVKSHEGRALLDN
jgi:DNA repair protein RecN (Recombination protein N)